MRILGLGLLVALVASAIGAGSALAAKDPGSNVETFVEYKYCPYEDPAITDCVYGRTNGGSGGGEFKYGKVTVKLSKPVIIQVGYKGVNPTTEASPAVGAPSLESGAEPIVGGLKVITKKIQEQAGWPEALKTAFAEAVKNKETKATVNIEMAGNECFEVPGCLNTENLIFEEGSAFRLALKVKVVNSWLEKLGGNCQIGSDENPIKQNLTSSGVGRAGDVTFNGNFTNIKIEGSQLIDTSWHIPVVAGANGCGNAEWESYINKALNLALEVEGAPEIPGNPGFERASKTGLTWLEGNLHDANADEVLKRHEEGEF